MKKSLLMGAMALVLNTVAVAAPQDIYIEKGQDDSIIMEVADGKLRIQAAAHAQPSFLMLAIGTQRADVLLAGNVHLEVMPELFLNLGVLNQDELILDLPEGLEPVFVQAFAFQALDASRLTVYTSKSCSTAGAPAGEQKEEENSVSPTSAEPGSETGNGDVPSDGDRQAEAGDVQADGTIAGEKAQADTAKEDKATNASDSQNSGEVSSDGDKKAESGDVQADGTYAK